MQTYNSTDPASNPDNYTTWTDSEQVYLLTQAQTAYYITLVFGKVRRKKNRIDIVF